MIRFVLRTAAGFYGLALAIGSLALALSKAYWVAAIFGGLAFVFVRYAVLGPTKAAGRSAAGRRPSRPVVFVDEQAGTSRRSVGARRSPARLVDNIWPAKHGFYGEVVGESHYQDALSAAVGGPPTEWREAMVTASLVCEFDNPHDSMAVAVFVGGHRVGYLRAENARAFHERLKRRGIAGQTTHCGALIRGGGVAADGTQRMFGITLNIQGFG